MSAMRSAMASTLACPTVVPKAWIWRLILDSATLSRSIKVSSATPLRAKASAAQEPTPPMPITTTWAARMRAAPSTPYKRASPPKRRSRSGSRPGSTSVTGSLHPGNAVACRRGSLGLRVHLDQVFQRLAGGLGVFQLGLAVGDRQCGLGGTWRVGGHAQQRLEVGNGLFVITRCILGIAQPEQRGRHVPALRIAPDEVGKRALRLREGPLAELPQRGFEILLLSRIHRELTSVHRHLDGLEAPQAVVHALGNVLLPPLQVGDVARELLVLPAQAGLLGAQGLDLGLQIQQAATQLAQVFSRPRGLLSLALGLAVHLLAQLDDGATGLIVTKQRSLAGLRNQGRTGQGHA